MKIALVVLALFSFAGAALAQPLPANSLQGVEPVTVTEKDSDGAYLGIGGWGRLSMDENGCLVIGEKSLMIWSAGTQASRTQDGRIRVIDGATGKAVYVGETIGFGGGGAEGPYPSERLAEPVPKACSALPFWTMGAFIQTAAEVRETLMREARPLPVTVPEGYSRITEWNEENIFELTRLLLTQFGNRIYDLEFVNEPTAYIVVKLSGESGVPSGQHQFGTYVVEAQFETGATERMGEVVDGLWERFAQPQVR